MGKRPADADPEKFIIGRGIYDNLQLARPWHDTHSFRIDPAPLPLGAMVALNGLFVVLFSGFYWLAEPHAPAALGSWGLAGVCLGIGLLTCGLFTAGVSYRFASARRRGPWLIMDKATGRIDLPHHGMRFQRSEVVQLQCITTKRLDWGGVANNQRLSELNLITCRDGRRQRWPLLRSNCNHGDVFDSIVTPLLEQTDLQVVRVQDQWLGWEVSERPYKRHVCLPSTTEVDR